MTLDDKLGLLFEKDETRREDIFLRDVFIKIPLSPIREEFLFLFPYFLLLRARTPTEFSLPGLIIGRYGLNGKHARTYAQLGEQHGVSKEQIRRNLCLGIYNLYKAAIKANEGTLLPFVREEVAKKLEAQTLAIKTLFKKSFSEQQDISRLNKHIECLKGVIIDPGTSNGKTIAICKDIIHASKKIDLLTARNNETERNFSRLYSY